MIEACLNSIWWEGTTLTHMSSLERVLDDVQKMARGYKDLVA
jgi:hypothetical protein